MIKLFAKKIDRPNSLSKEWLPDSYAVNLTLNNLLTPKSKLTDAEFITIVNTLNSIKHSISDYVKIITQKNINVVYREDEHSFTDGETIFISGTLNDGNIDATVGLVMHESSHIVYTDFNKFAEIFGYDDKIKYKKHQSVSSNYNLNGRISKLASAYNIDVNSVRMHLKTITNVLEDKRIDFNTTNKYPAYIDYYSALYYRYFNNPEKTLVFNSNMYTDESVESYMFRLINMVNPYAREDALQGLPAIFKLIDLKNIGRFNNTAEILDLSFDVLQIVYQHCYQNNTLKTESDSGDSDQQEDSNSKEGAANKKSKNKQSAKGNGSNSNSSTNSGGNNSDGDSSGGGGDDDNDDDYDNGEDDEDDSDGGDEDNDTDDSDGEKSDKNGNGNGGKNNSKDDEDGEKSDKNNTSPKEAGDNDENGGDKKKNNKSKTSKSDFNLKDDIIYVNSLDEVTFGDPSDPNAKPIDGKKVVFSEKAKKQLKKLLEKQQAEMDGNQAIINDDLAVVNELKTKSDSVQGTGITNYTVVFIKSVEECNVTNNTYDFFHSAECNNKEVSEGVAFGKMLYKKVNVLNEIKFENQIRRDRGHINKRLLHEIPSNNTNIFNRIKKTEYGEYSIHVSIDISGSMSGTKLKQCIKTVTALSTLSNMLNNKFNICISVRYESSNPVVAIIYDSTKDKYLKSLLVLKHLVAIGGTPEGLCYRTLNNYILKETKHKTPYFINFSDGEPTYNYNNYSGVDHTRDMVNMMRKNGINILSYFIEGGWGGSSESNFIEMYGKDAKVIDQNSILSVAKTLNDMFLDSLSSKMM